MEVIRSLPVPSSPASPAPSTLQELRSLAAQLEEAKAMAEVRDAQGALGTAQWAGLLCL